jgi:hypothetical protein
MLTTEQKATLKAFIESDQALNTLYVDGNLSGLADGLNAVATPSFIVWRTAVTQDEIMQNGFDWVQVDNLTVGKARIWEWMFKNLSVSINPSKINVRAGIEEAWKGTAAMLAVRAAIYVHCKRAASVIEKLFATGTGTDAVPATMTLEGPINYSDLVGL